MSSNRESMDEATSNRGWLAWLTSHRELRGRDPRPRRSGLSGAEVSRVSHQRGAGGAAGRSDRGVALILVLLAMLILTVLAATIVLTARAETFASYNYQLDTEADYLAKAGIQKAANWFRSNHYQPVEQPQLYSSVPEPPSFFYALTSSGAPLNLYTSNNSAVWCVGGGCPSMNSPVQLIGIPGTGSSNFPDIDNTEPSPVPVSTAFANDLVNTTVTDANGNTLGDFSVNAYLLNYQTVNVCPPAQICPPYTQEPVETWKLTALAHWTGGSGETLATAEEQAIIQPIFVPTWGNALYGFCSVTMQGSSGTCTDAFNSALGPYGGGNPSVASGACDSSSTNVIGSGAGVGANGYVAISSNPTVAGNVTIGNNPTGGSSCCTPSSNPACGYTGSTSSINGQVVNGPHVNPPPTPTFPSNLSTAPSYSVSGSAVILPVGASFAPPGSGGSNTIGSANQPCVSGGTCNGSASNPYDISSLTLSGNSSTFLDLVGSSSAQNPVYYDIGSLSESGNATIAISGYVVLNIQSSLSITGNGITNGIGAAIPPAWLTINYAGTNGVSIGGNGAVTAVLNAPNATVTLGGGGSSGYFIGSVQANNVVDQGGYPIHYDIQLSRVGGTLGQTLITAYSRKKM